jgi:hypothetical protein
MAIDQKHHYNRLSAAALVFGLLGVPVALLPFGVPVAILAVITGLAGRQQARRNGQPLRMANIAVVLGIAGIAVWVAVMLGFALLAGVYGD